MPFGLMRAGSLSRVNRRREYAPRGVASYLATYVLHLTLSGASWALGSRSEFAAPQLAAGLLLGLESLPVHKWDGLFGTISTQLIKLSRPGVTQGNTARDATTPFKYRKSDRYRACVPFDLFPVLISPCSCFAS